MPLFEWIFVAWPAAAKGLPILLASDAPVAALAACLDEQPKAG